MTKRFSPLFIAFSALLLSGCETESSNTFQGYAEGDYVYISSAVAGNLESLLVDKGARIGEGAPLYRLESEVEKQGVKEAETKLASEQAKLADMLKGSRDEEIEVTKAQLEQAKAEKDNANVRYQRAAKLIRTKSVAQSELDDAIAAKAVAEAKVSQLEHQIKVQQLPQRTDQIKAQESVVDTAKATLVKAVWNLNQKNPASPSPSLVMDTFYRKGEWVPAGNPIVQLLPDGSLKIRFFVPEAKLSSIKTGDKISFSADGISHPMTGTVSYISPSAEYTPPVIYSNETRSKLVFMAEAQPSKEDALKISAGQPVTVKLYD